MPRAPLRDPPRWRSTGRRARPRPRRRGGINRKYDELAAGERVRYGTQMAAAQATAARQATRAEYARQGLLYIDAREPMDQPAIARDYGPTLREAYAQNRVLFAGADATGAA